MLRDRRLSCVVIEFDLMSISGTCLLLYSRHPHTINRHSGKRTLTPTPAHNRRKGTQSTWCSAAQFYSPAERTAWLLRRYAPPTQARGWDETATKGTRALFCCVYSVKRKIINSRKAHKGNDRVCLIIMEKLLRSQALNASCVPDVATELNRRWERAATEQRINWLMMILYILWHPNKSKKKPRAFSSCEKWAKNVA